MAFNNAVNASQEGVQYINPTGTWSGVDGSTALKVLTSNGTGVAPSFQTSFNAASSSFLAYLTNTLSNVTGDSTDYQIIYDTLVSNVGSNFNLGTSVYTAPYNGVYYFSHITYVNNVTTADDLASYISAGGLIWDARSSPVIRATVTGFCLTNSLIIPLNANNTVNFHTQCSGQTKTINLLGATGSTLFNYVSGSLLARTS